MSDQPYRLRMAAAARRALERDLPEAVAAAAAELITGALLDEPWRVGKALRDELGGLHSARRGAYRVIYRIDETNRTVTVARVEHRADVYRP